MQKTDTAQSGDNLNIVYEHIWIIISIKRAGIKQMLIRDKRPYKVMHMKKKKNDSVDQN